MRAAGLRRPPLKRWAVMLATVIAGGCSARGPAGPAVPSPLSAMDPAKLGLLPGVKASDGQLVVGLVPGHRISELPALNGAQPTILGTLNFAIPLDMLKLPAGVSVEDAIKAYRSNPSVALIAPNQSLGTVPKPAYAAFGQSNEISPNDPFFPMQWCFEDSVTNARALWTRGIDASKVLVAVIDTGVDYNHPDLEGRVVVGYNFKDGNEDIMDHDGHGTHVAGLIAAAGNNGVGVAGVSWSTRILAVKVMDGTGGTDYGAIAGIKYAVDVGAKVLNLSFSSDNGARNPLFDLAVQYAHDHGVTVVAAAGNSHGPVSAPGNSPDALAISATTEHGMESLADFSNFGPQVFLAAPGDSILSTYPGGTYKSLSGTSMAAPIVSGAAAVLYAEHPGWSCDQVRAALSTSVDTLGTSGRTDQYGYGRIDLGKLP